MPLRRLGTVARVAQGLLVVRVPPDADRDTPDIGTAAVDESLTTVGRVVDVFGPVDRPYLALDPTDGIDLASLLDEAVYAR